MFAPKTREPRIIYVAASARELPGEVQAWLGRVENRAASSPNIYDALALLASGSRPTVLIVSIAAVDWSEMEFFDQVARLSRQTHVYVTGHEHHAAKLTAACKHGAELFDEAALREDLAAPGPWSRGPGVSDLLAGTVPKTPVKLAPPIALRPVPFEPLEPELPEPVIEAPATEEVAEVEPPVRPGTIIAPEPEETEAEPVRLFDTPEPAISEEPVAEDAREPIPFPWAPSTRRPQRIPPKAHAAPTEPAAPAPPPANPTPPAAPMPRQPVELTAEELAALMGRPMASDTSAREGTG